MSFAVCLVGPHFELQPRWVALIGVTVALTLLAFDVGAVALLVGALTGSRGAAMGAVGDDQLERGVTVAELGALAAVGVVLLVGTILAFRRLDIE